MNSDNLTGITLANRYDMLEKIGTGGMATVYKAKDTLLNRNVAIKILRDSLEDEKNVVSNFIKEAQSSASLVHNNIVSVYDVGEENGLNYMVMEYVDGITLKEYIKQNGALPWQEACDFAIQIGQGISEAHSINIIHRDIKPQNILMTKDKTLKVTDFGIARAVAGETTVVGGSALGSVHYISPEQARGGYTDARSDIYSLGIVLYEMLTGKVPFDGDTAVSVALMHLEKEPVNVKVINLDIPTDLAYVTMKSVSKEPSARYQSVQVLLDDLHAVLADEPLPSREAKYRKTMSETEQESDDDYDVLDEVDDDIAEIPEDIEIGEDDMEQRGRSNRKTEVKKKNQKQKKEDRIAVVLAISTIVVAALVALAVYFGVNMSKEASVPDFTNMTIEEATAAANKEGLKIADEIEYSLSDTVEENRVISQNPEARKIVKKNSEIKLVVSIGSSGGNISAPNVVNKLFDEAVAEIIGAGLNYTVQEENSDEIAAGYIIRQTPLAGTKLTQNDTINLHVSKGSANAQPTAAAETVSVPSIIGLGRDQAEATLRANGLGLGNVSRKASTAAEGTVISQSPDLGKSVPKGSIVSVVLSRGPEAETPQTETNAQNETPQNENNESQQNEPETSGEDNESSEMSTRTFTVKIPDTANDTVNVEIVVNGRTHYSGVHSKSEGTVSLDIKGSGTAEVQAYIDGSKVSDRTINFN